MKRNSRFTMDVLVNGKTIKCHCPTTGRICAESYFSPIGNDFIHFGNNLSESIDEARQEAYDMFND